MKDKRHKASVMIVLMLLFVIALPLNASDGWEANIVVTVQNAENKLSFGQKADATDGIDGRYDVPAMLSGDIEAYFLCEGESLWRDIRGNSMRNIWDMRIESPLTEKTIVLRWKPDILPEGVEINLIDASSGKAIDLKAETSYSYTNTGPRDFRLEITNTGGR